MEEREMRAQLVADKVRRRLGDLTARDGPPPDIAEAAADSAAAAVRELPDPLKTDPWIYRLVVAGLVVALLGCIALMGAMRLIGAGTTEIPDAIVAVASGALGALAGLLAPSPGNTT